MKLSLNLAQQFSNVDLKKLSKDELLQKIGRQLAAVEDFEEWGPRFDGIVVVKVVSCEKHPNADKLSICKIDDGKAVKGVKRDEKGFVQVVCGAPNVKTGMLAAWIPPGVTVPATRDKDPFVLDAREIRGEVSNGMLASAHELGISDDHSGILEVMATDIGEQPKIGTQLKKYYDLDDLVIDLENKMFTHRPDLFGILGLARELAGIDGKTFKSPDWYLNEPTFKTANELPLEVKVKSVGLVPRFMAVAIKGVKVGPSPYWLQAALTRAGIRPINNIVDITNYIMQLTAQPMHAYDYDKVKAHSGAKPILIAREAADGEKLKLLNGKTLEFKAPAIMIATDKEAVGVGGVMGGADTEVDENTTNIILEAATFDMYSIRRTAMKYGLFTDAVTRFNKGQSPLQNDRVMAYAMKNVFEIAGGEQAGIVHDVHGHLRSSSAVTVSASFINERLGLSLTPKKISELLQNVEFKAMNLNKGKLGITPPFWRTDIEIPEDIVEEVGRLYGYDHLPVELPVRTIKPTKRNELMDFKAKIRKLLAKAGANEVLTYSFVHGGLLDKVGQDKEKAFRLSNAISPDLQYYRLSLTPSLLDKVHPNIKAGVGEFAIFEIGKGHNKDQKDETDKTLPKEFEMLSLIYAAGDKKAAQNSAAFYQARHYLDSLASSLGISLRYSLIEKEEDYQAAKPYDFRRSASVWDTQSGLPLGMIGEFKQSAIKNLKLPVATAGFEIGIEQLLAASGKGTKYHVLPKFPKVEQDMTLKVPADLLYGEFDQAIETATKESVNMKNHFVSRQLRDIYQKGKTTKNITYRFRIANYERTMTDKEVNKILDEIAAKAHAQFGAERV